MDHTLRMSTAPEEKVATEASACCSNTEPPSFCVTEAALRYFCYQPLTILIYSHSHIIVQAASSAKDTIVSGAPGCPCTDETKTPMPTGKKLFLGCNVLISLY
jgi:hypothetical protein